MYNLLLTRQAVKDSQKLEQAGLKTKAAFLLRVIRKNPVQNPPPYEKLQGYSATYSRRINIQHRLVYQVFNNAVNNDDVPYDGTVKIIRMWTHYE
ncbi:addiction module protein [Spirochaetia bacterium]|nr:addiction module protein [Spirochaetia bacterium]